MNYHEAKKIMGKNFIGPDELAFFSDKLNVPPLSRVPEIPYAEKLLKKLAKEYILILGIPKTKDGELLTLNNMRSSLGWDPAQHEPCFYNQD